MAAGLFDFGVRSAEFVQRSVKGLLEFVKSDENKETENKSFVKVSGNCELLEEEHYGRGKRLKLILDLHSNPFEGNESDKKPVNGESISKNLVAMLPYFPKKFLEYLLLSIISLAGTVRKMLISVKSIIWKHEGHVYYDPEDRREKISPKRRLKKNLFGTVILGKSSLQGFTIESLKLSQQEGPDDPNTVPCNGNRRKSLEKRKFSEVCDQESEYSSYHEDDNDETLISPDSSKIQPSNGENPVSSDDDNANTPTLPVPQQNPESSSVGGGTDQAKPISDSNKNEAEKNDVSETDEDTETEDANYLEIEGSSGSENDPEFKPDSTRLTPESSYSEHSEELNELLNENEDILKELRQIEQTKASYSLQDNKNGDGKENGSDNESKSTSSEHDHFSSPVSSPLDSSYDNVEA